MGDTFVLWSEHAIRVVNARLEPIGKPLLGPKPRTRAHRIVRLGGEHSNRAAVIWLPSNEDFKRASVQVLDTTHATWVAPPVDLAGVEVHQMAPLGDAAVLVGETEAPGNKSVLQGAVISSDGRLGPWQRWVESPDAVVNVVIGQRLDRRTLLQFSTVRDFDQKNWAVELKADATLFAQGRPTVSRNVSTFGLVGADGIYVYDDDSLRRWTCK